ncbi:arginine deiminase-related protein [Sphingobacterium sp. E70]|uniref:arginine deiminase-related protein n=1 Tax=Sphingobacterium sp. E70 TaxID=2853439 RepID=UPI00211BB0B6|nr:arginine deiminase-related protein [Sphingobacterium sp. E70]
MRKQVTDSVLLVRPSVFRKNEQTAVNNFFQKDIENLSGEDVNREAQGEFDALVNELKSHGILVTVIQDDENPKAQTVYFRTILSLSIRMVKLSFIRCLPPTVEKNIY